jgi:hypothetical protein
MAMAVPVKAQPIAAAARAVFRVVIKASFYFPQRVNFLNVSDVASNLCGKTPNRVVPISKPGSSRICEASKKAGERGTASHATRSPQSSSGGTYGEQSATS